VLWYSVIAAQQSFRAIEAMKFLEVSTALLVCAKAFPLAQGNELSQKRLQASAPATLFQAKYLARFQVLADPYCQPDSPTVRVECDGTDIKVLNVSHPSISCGTVAETDTEGKSYISCQNTCAGDACEDVYLTVGGDSEDGIFGAVEFECAGSTISDVQGSLSVEGNADQGCAGSVQEYNRLFHFAQLGIACPGPSGSTSTSYVFDDFYFECGGLAFARQHRKEVNGDDIYTCGIGDNCYGSACTIDIAWLTVNSKVTTFPGLCVNPPQDVPTQPVLPEGDSELKLFTARFEAAWGNMYDDVAAAWCANDSLSVQVSCRNGPIRFLNATATVKCKNLNQSTIECRDSIPSNVHGKFTGVAYVSGGGIRLYRPKMSHKLSPTIRWTCTRNARGRRYRKRSLSIRNRSLYAAEIPFLQLLLTQFNLVSLVATVPSLRTRRSNVLPSAINSTS
jgi:hypothetical protein